MYLCLCSSRLITYFIIDARILTDLISNKSNNYFANLLGELLAITDPKNNHYSAENYTWYNLNTGRETMNGLDTIKLIRRCLGITGLVQLNKFLSTFMHKTVQIIFQKFIFITSQQDFNNFVVENKTLKFKDLNSLEFIGLPRTNEFENEMQAIEILAKCTEYFGLVNFQNYSEISEGGYIVNIFFIYLTIIYDNYIYSDEKKYFVPKSLKDQDDLFSIVLGICQILKQINSECHYKKLIYLLVKHIIFLYEEPVERMPNEKCLNCILIYNIIRQILKEHNNEGIEILRQIPEIILSNII
ncbi:hypothetical protein HZS_1124 [Henneguya salminicola]|nr:hypothetical protein HZS_1124 [Henneguya salminicola]